MTRKIKLKFFMTLSLTFAVLLWFFSPVLSPRVKFFGKVALGLIAAYEFSRIVYHAVFGLT